MKRFHYIDKNELESLDLISLLDNATNYKLTYDEIVIALSVLTKYVTIKPKKWNRQGEIFTDEDFNECDSGHCGL